MSEHDIESLEREVREFREEKERIRNLIGQIGGNRSSKQDKFITIASFILISLLFTIDILRYLFKFEIPLPEMFLVQTGVFLISLKIIWMLYKQTKVAHFQFWILNSIEFRLNSMAKQLDDIKKP